MPDSNIIWTRPKLLRFKDAIARARADRRDPFTFDGHEFVLSYATYLAEYLTIKLMEDAE
jgi:hypothetical protein